MVLAILASKGKSMLLMQEWRRRKKGTANHEGPEG